ncbi:hypothetical protein NXZ75_01105, partial [Lysinibacillus sphaericus]|uniref:hypothetical protein n=1 Tax=Lysinibacillus sphaericus TaxID=1421 RepID=UPI00216396E6
MLKEIQCEKFREKVIIFNSGLNAILGDSEGSNSIGKSSLLMIIDFIFGGDTYLKHNRDTVEKLGNHDFYFKMEFDGVSYYFCRGTENSDSVFKCNEDYSKTEEINIKDYRSNLKAYYKLNFSNLSFRSAVSLFSRVWGKGNYDINKPLHTVPEEKALNAITRLIKLFNEYDQIDKEEMEIKQLTEKKSVISKAGKMQVIPKITKTNYEKNRNTLEDLKKELEQLSKSIFSPEINISEILSQEVYKLKEKKNFLLSQLEYHRSRLARVNRTISKSVEAKFNDLLEFFPNVNIEKLKNIESFHEGIASILSKELRNAKKDLIKKISLMETEINDINIQLELILNPSQKSSVYLDKLVDLSSEMKNIQLENDHYEKLVDVNDDINNKTKELTEIKDIIIKNIEEKINTG